MNLRICTLLFLVTLLISCEKEDEVAPENYLKATIDGKSFVAYENGSLNKDTVPNTFNFSFGRTVTDKKDTCLFISACLNRNNLSISFPKPTDKSTYPIYCKSQIAGQSSAFYATVPNYAEENGLTTYFTQNVLSDAAIEGQTIGEIVIDAIDVKRRLIEGHFHFTALGYETLTETYISTGDAISISNGEFCYQWDESLSIYSEQ